MFTALVALLTMLSLIFAMMFLVFIMLCMLLAVLLLTLRSLLNQRRNRLPSGDRLRKTIAFFHPYCNAGGGGERVLWCAIRALQNKYDDADIVIYTGDVDATPVQIVSKARERFNVRLPRDVTFVYLNFRKLVEASTYPHFTLLGQSVGSMLLSLEALTKFVPETCFDSMGYAFTLPIFRYLGGCRAGCYVHYPTVSTDMLRRVGDNEGTNRLFRSAKTIYYRMFAKLYGLAGSASQLIMVNSSWTREHILHLWNRPLVTFLVYPPCDVAGFRTIQRDRSKSYAEHGPELSVVSVSQFRPEKDHRLQIVSFQRLLANVADRYGDRLRLKLIGGCRNAEDERRVDDLRKLALELGVSEKIGFELNVSFDELKTHLENATVGLHTMWNEHFGIGIVECMAAGVVMLAHDSGGPKMDIVVDYEGRKTGFLAADAHGFAETLETILNLSDDERLEIGANARRSTERFSDEIFEANFLNLFQTFFVGDSSSVTVSSH